MYVFADTVSLKLRSEAWSVALSWDCQLRVSWEAELFIKPAPVSKQGVLKGFVKETGWHWLDSQWNMLQIGTSLQLFFSKQIDFERGIRPAPGCSRGFSMHLHCKGKRFSFFQNLSANSPLCHAVAASFSQYLAALAAKCSQESWQKCLLLY